MNRYSPFYFCSFVSIHPYLDYRYLINVVLVLASSRLTNYIPTTLPEGSFTFETPIISYFFFSTFPCCIYTISSNPIRLIMLTTIIVWMLAQITIGKQRSPQTQQNGYLRPVDAIIAFILFDVFSSTKKLCSRRRRRRHHRILTFHFIMLKLANLTFE